MSKKSTLNEASLIESLRHDSSEAFNTIYDAYFNRVYAYCLQISKSEHKAKDITQDVFLKLWEHRHEILADQSISPYLFRIARNQLVSAYREALNSAGYEAYVKYRSQPEAEFQSPMEYREFKIRIRECLDEMPESQRKVVVMSRFRNLSNKEIADRLNLSEQTVKNRLVMGLKALKRFIGDSTKITVFAFSSSSLILMRLLQL